MQKREGHSVLLWGTEFVGRWQIILQGLILWPSSVRVMATWPITMNINIQTLKTRRNTYLCQIKDTVHSCVRIHIVKMLNFNNIAHLKLPTGWLLLLIPPLISTLWQYFVCKQGHRIFNGCVWFSENRFFVIFSNSVYNFTYCLNRCSLLILLTKVLTYRFKFSQMSVKSFTVHTYALSFYRSQNILCQSKFFEPAQKFDCI